MVTRTRCRSGSRSRLTALTRASIRPRGWRLATTARTPLQESRTAAWGGEDAPGDDPAGELAIDDEEEEAPQEKVLHATDGDDALADRGGASEAAKAGLVDNPAVADPAGPGLATSAPIIPD